MRDVPLAVVAEAAQDVPPEAAEVRDVPLAVVAEAAQDVPREAAEVRDVPLAVVAEAAQDVPREAAEVRDEPLVGALPWRSRGRRCCLRRHLRRFLFWRRGLRDNERRCLRVGRK